MIVSTVPYHRVIRIRKIENMFKILKYENFSRTFDKKSFTFP